MNAIFRKGRTHSNDDITPNVITIGGGGGTNIKTLSLKMISQSNI